MTSQPTEPKPPWLPPRWFIRSAWVVHRAIHRFTGGRRGLATPTPGGKFGYLRLKTLGRHSGKERAAILGYWEDGPNLITLAMNGWAEAEPAWWLNLQAHPDASVELQERLSRGPRASREGRGTGSPVGQGSRVQRLRQRRRRIRKVAVVRDGGRHPGTEARPRGLTYRLATKMTSPSSPVAGIPV